MAKSITLLLFIGIAMAASGQQDDMRPEIICYASDHVHHTRVMPAINSLRMNQEPRSEFIVEYIGFSEEAKAAFQHAVDLWEAIIVSDVPIRIQASWEALDAGVLGSASSNGSFRNFEGAPLRDIDYPVALAEKLARANLNGSFEADMMANFSSNINWYYGTDGNPTAGEYDLVSVVMHEIGHGLGIAGSFGANVTDEIAGHSLFTGFPRIYDTYLTTGGTTPVIDRSAYPDGASIYTAITSNSLIFRSDLVIPFNSFFYPRIYSPNPYNGGSSVSHLDEDSFQAGDENSLMTPFIGQAEAIHDPGEVLMAMMIDMGWEYAFFDHAELADTEDEFSNIHFEMDFNADMDIVPGSVELVYEIEGVQYSGSMTEVSDGSYEIDLPNPGISLVTYGFAVTDEYDRTITSPEMFTIDIGPDEEFPEIIHEPLGPFRKFGNDALPALDIAFSDNLGVESAVLEYRLNGGQTSTLDLLTSNPVIPIELESLEFGDLIEYRIVVTDASSRSNVSVLPTEGYYDLLIIDIIREAYENDFELGGQAFVGDDFYVFTEEDFDNNAIHSVHPYPLTTEYVLDFLGEVVIDDREVVVSYEDIALIEPGVSGSVFGISAFKDYITLEGSTDTENWVPLAGYDAQRHTEWLDAYNSNLEDGVSLADGNPTLFRSNQIVLNDYFDTGDIVYLRFRLFSDLDGTGWGWVMDNFQIDYVEKVLSANIEEFTGLYPNPTSEEVYLTDASLESQFFQIYDQSGRLMLKGTVYNQSISIADLDQGLYFLTIRTHTGLIKYKFIKI